MANRKLRRKTRRCNYRKKNSRANRRGLAFASRSRSRRTYRKAKRGSRRQRGGDYIEGTSRPFFATVYPNSLQTTYADVTGATPNNYPGSPLPENMTAPHSWYYISNGTIIPADIITPINTAFTLMAGNTPYNPNPLVAPGVGVSSGAAMPPSSAAAAANAAAAASGPQTSISTQLAIGTQRSQSF